jgi:gamma-glutamyl-gamma-aminobutyrate hydrolase PuuD
MQDSNPRLTVWEADIPSLDHCRSIQLCPTWKCGKHGKLINFDGNTWQHNAKKAARESKHSLFIYIKTNYYGVNKQYRQVNC